MVQNSVDSKGTRLLILLPPANEVCEGYVFTPVSVILFTGGDCIVGGACMAGGHVWWEVGGGGGRVCMAGGHVWQGGMHGRGACMAEGVCMVGDGGCMAGGHAWQGCVHGKGGMHAMHAPPTL